MSRSVYPRIKLMLTMTYDSLRNVLAEGRKR